ncbi:MAG: histone deacetylase [Actinomycetota bacterium]|nr:histone deacetylase [Actinomycetota bacterium]
MLLVTDERFLNHRAGSRHPEQPARLNAVWAGIEAAGVNDALVRLEPRMADFDELMAVHPATHLARLGEVDAAGGGRIDPDTVMNADSWTAARLAAGAGLVAVDALRDGVAELAFCAVRPPGHHATADRSMGFCLLNNVAVVATALAGAGQRVAIVDVDAHHGNGTQDIFYDDDRVLFVSCHQWPLYPGTGAADEIGTGAGVGTTVNVPVPPGTAGDDYRYAMDALVIPVVERFTPDWLLVSAGFDAHRSDPLTDLGLTSGDYADLMATLVGLVPAGRLIVFLEGGYDLDALADSAGASVAALLGLNHRPEGASGSMGVAPRLLVDNLARRHGVA